MDLAQKKAKIDSEFQDRWCDLAKAAQARVHPPFTFGQIKGDQFQVTKPRTMFDQSRLTLETGTVPTPFPKLGCALEVTRPLRVEVHGWDGYDPPESRYLFDADDEGPVFLRASRNYEKLSPGDAAEAILRPFLEKCK